MAMATEAATMKSKKDKAYLCMLAHEGAESKLEKAHHAIAHFANTGMRHTLADYLGMAGLALYNLRICYRHKVAELPAAKRALIPTAFQNAPAFTNHLRLSRNNSLGRQAGLDVDEYKQGMLRSFNRITESAFFMSIILKNYSERRMGLRTTRAPIDVCAKHVA